MKRLIPVLLVLCLLLSACGGPAEPTTAPATGSTQAPTTVPTTEPAPQPSTAPTVPTTQPPTEPSTEPPTEPTEAPVLYRNPLNGQPLDAPYVGRFFGVTINNVRAGLPMRGVNQADLFFEMYINDYCTRGLAVFSNVAQVESIGSIRSTRLNFTDIALAYDLIVVHAGGGLGVLEEMRDLGVNNFSADGPIGYRDSYRYQEQGYSWEHTLFARGEELLKAAQKKGYDLAMTGQDYGLRFTEEATPAGGETANQVTLTFKLNGSTKKTTMIYDAEAEKYVFWQYGQQMVDENTFEPITFKNVIFILTYVGNQGVYHVAEMYGSGSGWFACNGKIIPIRWIHENEKDPFYFTLEDGTPLELGVGNTYIAVAPTRSPVTYE